VPPTKLFVENSEAWRAGCRAPVASRSPRRSFGFWRFDWEDRAEGFLARLFTDLRESQPWIRRGGYALAGRDPPLLGLARRRRLPSSCELGGHVLVAALWSSVAVLLVFTPCACGASRCSPRASRS